MTSVRQSVSRRILLALPITILLMAGLDAQTAPVQQVMACAQGQHVEVTSDGAYLCRSIDLPGHPAAPQPLPASTEPVLIYSEDPIYPLHALNGTLQGDCLISFTVGRDGVPQDIHVTKSLSPELDEAALDAVSQYKFKPATRDGQPVAMQVSLDLAFRVSSR